MSQTYAPPSLAPGEPQRRMIRPASGRWVAGVCAGLADHLGIPVVWVRVAMLVLIAAGPGWAAYPMLWGLTAQEDEQAGSIDPAAPPSAQQSEDHGWVRWLVIPGVVLAVLGLVVGFAGDYLPPLSLVLPIVAVVLIAALGLANADAVQRDRWLGRRSGWPAVARFAVGIVAIFIGAVAAISGSSTAGEVSDTAVATVVVILGLTLLLAPWAVRLWRETGTAQAARARADERADIAAHLHDSVLQTLTLIQRQAGDNSRVATLARVQERELRAYLYGASASAESTLTGAVRAVIDEVEMAHGIPVDVVVTGERDLDERVTALVRATREALLNAVRHGAAPVALYVEVGGKDIEAFVRDHGAGLDLDAMPEDRLGVRESIMGRMHRAGGEASVRHRDPGTEWTLTLPLTPETGGTNVPGA